jgi:PPM family protein phosphatase
MQHYHFSHIGLRSENQDSYGFETKDNVTIACIADGVGGANEGKYASSYSVTKFLELAETSQLLDKLIFDIHKHVIQLQADEKFRGMASTFSGFILKDFDLQGVHLGDSRICVLRNNGIKQLTDSHTEAFRLLKAGKLEFDDIEDYPRKNIIESAIGIQGALNIHYIYFHLQPKDRILLTTDGVHELISKKEFRDLSIHNNDVESFGKAIENLLLSRKYNDNMTFGILQV